MSEHEKEIPKLASRHFMALVEGMPWRDRGSDLYREIVEMPDGSEVELVLLNEGKAKLFDYCDRIARERITIPSEATPERAANIIQRQWSYAAEVRAALCWSIVQDMREARAKARLIEAENDARIQRENIERNERRAAIQATGDPNAEVTVRYESQGYRNERAIIMESASPRALAAKVDRLLHDLGPRVSGAYWSSDYTVATVIEYQH